MADTEKTTAPTATTPVSEEDLKTQLKRQLEFYFSLDNLANDKFLVSQMSSDHYVLLSIVAGFRLVRQLTEDMDLIVSVLKTSDVVELDTTCTKVRPMTRTTTRSTMIMREVPDATTEEDIEKLLADAGSEPAKHIRKDIENMWFITFASADAATESLFKMRTKKINGAPVRVRIKSEPILRSAPRTAYLSRTPSGGATAAAAVANAADANAASSAASTANGEALAGGDSAVPTHHAMPAQHHGGHHGSAVQQPQMQQQQQHMAPPMTLYQQNGQMFYYYPEQMPMDGQQWYMPVGPDGMPLQPNAYRRSSGGNGGAPYNGGGGSGPRGGGRAGPGGRGGGGNHRGPYTAAGGGGGGNASAAGMTDEGFGPEAPSDGGTPLPRILTFMDDGTPGGQRKRTVRTDRAGLLARGVRPRPQGDQRNYDGRNGGGARGQGRGGNSGGGDASQQPQQQQYLDRQQQEQLTPANFPPLSTSVVETRRDDESAPRVPFSEIAKKPATSAPAKKFSTDTEDSSTTSTSRNDSSSPDKTGGDKSASSLPTTDASITTTTTAPPPAVAAPVTSSAPAPTTAAPATGASPSTRTWAVPGSNSSGVPLLSDIVSRPSKPAAPKQPRANGVASSAPAASSSAAPKGGPNKKQGGAHKASKTSTSSTSAAAAAAAAAVDTTASSEDKKPSYAAALFAKKD